jgi:hypothetical protein
MARSYSNALNLDQHLFVSKVKHFISALFLTIAMLFLTLTLAAQEKVMAQVSENGVIELPVNRSVESAYIIALSDAEFDSDQDMISHFSSYNCELFLMRGLPSRNEVVVMPQLKGRESWTVEMWNEALKATCEAKPFTTRK